MDSSSPLQIAILLFDGADLLDAGGPYEVFLTAARLTERDGDPSPFRVDTFTIDGGPVTAYGGLGLVPTADAGILGQADIVVVPGTIDLSVPLADDRLIDVIGTAGRNDDRIVASVCTGSFLLAEAGLLDDTAWTTHWEDVDLLAAKLGPAGARTGVRWVDEGPVVTAAGLSSGIAMALHLVERVVDTELARRTAAQLDYEWSPVTSAGAPPG